jgi:hypothetical protein
LHDTTVNHPADTIPDFIRPDMDAIGIGYHEAVRKLESCCGRSVQSAIPEEKPSAKYFEALQMVNGVRPQLNCNVCIQVISISMDWMGPTRWSRLMGCRL